MHCFQIVWPLGLLPVLLTPTHFMRLGDMLVLLAHGFQLSWRPHGAQGAQGPYGPMGPIGPMGPHGPQFCDFLGF